ncbi:MAG: asparagine synthase-related protein [Thermoplasmata archaeon]|nr:asparagine synthase-related protein [Thermoplasmata archaeon]
MVPPIAGSAANGAGGFLRAFHSAIATLPEPLTVLYSGGLDSSLVGFCTKELGHAVRLSVIGSAHAPDLVEAESGARLLGLPLSSTILEPLRVHQLLGDDSLGLLDTPEPSRSVRLAFALALATAPGTNLVCGQGADELFGGYAHFRGLDLARAERVRTADLARALDVEWPWALDHALAIGRSVWAPFLDPGVCGQALSIPVSETLGSPPPKRWLRELALAHGLPPPLVERPKRAMQYGSGVRKLLPRSVPTTPTRTTSG